MKTPWGGGKCPRVEQIKGQKVADLDQFPFLKISAINILEKQDQSIAIDFGSVSIML